MNVVITGCSRGIGFQLLKFFSQNHQVYCVTRNTSPIEDYLKENPELESNVHYKSLDLSDVEEKDLGGLFDGLDEVHVLINNAGYLVNKSFSEISAGDLSKMYDVNVIGPFKLTQYLLEPLKKVKGHVVNISSMGGVQGASKFPGLSAYSSSKGALSILTECLAEELGADGVKVNCLALGAVQTEMLEEAFPGYEAPLKPAQMAKFIYDFALESGKYMNGKIIPVSLSTP